MKKLFPIAIIALSTLSFFSCKKSSSSSTYLCTCKYKNFGSATDTTVVVTYPSGTSSSAAQTDCSSESNAIKIIDSTGSCTYSSK